MSIKIQSGKQYLRCTKRLNNKACPGCGKVYTEDVENYVYKEMVRKLREGQSPATYTKLNENPQVKQIYREIEEMEKEISLLVDSLAGAGETLTDYINQRVEASVKAGEIIGACGESCDTGADGKGSI